MQENNNKVGSFLKSSLPLIYLIVALLALRWTLVEPYVVPTSSMEPTLKTGDRLYALKCAYDIRFPFTEWILFRTGEVKRGDVILFRAPRDPSITYVKRAVGLPGDKLQFRKGALYVNGQEAQKAPFGDRGVMYDIEGERYKTLYLENLTGVKHYVILDGRVDESPEDQYLRHRDSDEITVPEGHLFASGDNRDNSHDSRAWGFVPMENLKGKGIFIWYSSPNLPQYPDLFSTAVRIPYLIFTLFWNTRLERIGSLIQ